LNQCDIFILLETFVTENEKEFFSEYFHNFKVKFQFAHRNNNFGRAIGGADLLNSPKKVSVSSVQNAKNSTYFDN